jgi:5-methylcytosine-specific restriction endonuclease McrA
VSKWGGQRVVDIGRNLMAQGRPCWLCGQPIDYQLPRDHPMAFTIDHIKTKHERPDLIWEPSNHAPAHALCNKKRGTGPPPRSLGQPTAAW